MIRTCDPRLRRPMLYPAELWARGSASWRSKLRPATREMAFKRVREISQARRAAPARNSLPRRRQGYRRGALPRAPRRKAQEARTRGDPVDGRANVRAKGAVKRKERVSERKERRGRRRKNKQDKQRKNKKRQQAKRLEKCVSQALPSRAPSSQIGKRYVKSKQEEDRCAAAHSGGRLLWDLSRLRASLSKGQAAGSARSRAAGEYHRVAPGFCGRRTRGHGAGHGIAVVPGCQV